MTPLAKRTPFGGRILMLGCGSVGQCTLPLVRRHVDLPADRITVMDFEDVRPRIADSLQAGVSFKRERLTQDNYPALLGRLVGPGDAIVDLSWNVETFDMLSWCAEHRVNYINTSLEEWDPYGDILNKSPYERSLVFPADAGPPAEGPAQLGREARRDRDHRPRRQPRPRQSLHQAGAARNRHRDARKRPACGHRREQGGVREADRRRGERGRRIVRAAQPGHRHQGHPHRRTRHAGLQRSRRPSTSSSTRGRSRASTRKAPRPPSSAGARTRRRLPRNAHTPIGGPGNQIFLAQPGIRTYVHSWVAVPAGPSSGWWSATPSPSRSATT